MCLCEHMHMSEGTHGNRRHQIPLALELKAGYEPPDVDDGNQTWILCKSNTCP